MYVHHMDGTDWAVMSLWMLLVLVAAGVLILALITWARRDSSTDTAPRPSARELLDERLARGEIEIDEYRQRRAAIDQLHPAR